MDRQSAVLSKKTKKSKYMKSLDNAIATMKSNGCVNCRLETAICDWDEQEVYIKGSFCSPAPEYAMIQITAYNKETNEEVWTKECETGTTCSIPFTTQEEFSCH